MVKLAIFNPKQNKINFLFYYPSDAGTHPPASCIFGQFIDITAFFGNTRNLEIINCNPIKKNSISFNFIKVVLVTYIRYLQIKSLSKSSKILTGFNRFNFVVGLAIGLGMVTVGNFQVRKTNHKGVVLNLIKI